MINAGRIFTLFRVVAFPVFLCMLPCWHCCKYYLLSHLRVENMKPFQDEDKQWILEDLEANVPGGARRLNFKLHKEMFMADEIFLTLAWLFLLVAFVLAFVGQSRFSGTFACAGVFTGLLSLWKTFKEKKKQLKCQDSLRERGVASHRLPDALFPSTAGNLSRRVR